MATEKVMCMFKCPHCPPKNQAITRELVLTQCSDEENRSSVTKPHCLNSRSPQGDADLCTFKLGE